MEYRTADNAKTMLRDIGEEISSVNESTKKDIAAVRAEVLDLRKFQADRWEDQLAVNKNLMDADEVLVKDLMQLRWRVGILQAVTVFALAIALLLAFAR